MEIKPAPVPVIPITVRRIMQDSFHHAMETALSKVTLRQSCLDCQFFDEPTEICGHWKSRPPARILVSGCEEFNP